MMKAMKKWLLFLLPLVLAAGLSSCEKPYEEHYGSLYHKDAEGNKVCNMCTFYKVTRAANRVVMVVYYSGSWKASLTEEIDWGFIDRRSGDGVDFLRFNYTTNDSGSTRTAVIHIKCDNGDTADITISQEG